MAARNALKVWLSKIVESSCQEEAWQIGANFSRCAVAARTPPARFQWHLSARDSAPSAPPALWICGVLWSAGFVPTIDRHVLAFLAVVPNSSSLKPTSGITKAHARDGIALGILKMANSKYETPLACPESPWLMTTKDLNMLSNLSSLTISSQTRGLLSGSTGGASQSMARSRQQSFSHVASSYLI